MCIMFQKTYSESHCFCLKPTAQWLSKLWESAYLVQLYVWICITFRKILPKAIASDWSPSLTVLSLSAYFVQLNVWMCIMFWKTSSESNCFCLKPTTQCTFTERILCSIVCLHVYNVSKNFLWKPSFLLEAHHSSYFDRAHTFFNCLFECV